MRVEREGIIGINHIILMLDTPDVKIWEGDSHAKFPEMYGAAAPVPNSIYKFYLVQGPNTIKVSDKLGTTGTVIDTELNGDEWGFIYPSEFRYEFKIAAYRKPSNNSVGQYSLVWETDREHCADSTFCQEDGG